jgi:uncharacterized membrane protein
VEAKLLSKSRIESRNRIRWLVTVAVLVAIMMVLDLTGIGYIPIASGIEITLMMIPVIIGAITCGKWASTLLGAVFGLTAVILCLTGKSPLGVICFQINPFATVVMDIVGRAAVGFLTGLVFECLSKLDRHKLWSYAAAGVVGSVFNTVQFVVLVSLVFGGDPVFQKGTESFGLSLTGLSVWAVMGVFFGVVAIQAAIEAVTCALLGGSIAKALKFAFKNWK